MKQKDITLIVVITVLSAVISYFISGKIFVPQQNRQQSVEVVEAIKSEFKSPDPKYFNAQSIDPTQLIQVTKNDNQSPFNNNNQPH